MFIYHSKNDLNCPYPLTLQLVDELKKAGAEVEFVSVSESGHGVLDQESFPKFNSWLKVLLKD
jgi:dipeptidyl aminopeptidase/acylaminoacyl peptidase